tara:strand:+ start:553 stop:2286 length:1734 start_codon:yes stop_codon:yes gene_type:complete
MTVIKGFKLTNTVLATALALALSGCGDEMLSTVNSGSATTDSGISEPDISEPNISEPDISEPDTTDPTFTENTFILISSSGEESDIDYANAEYAVGTWETGSVINGEATYEGISAWEITKGPNTPEQGNWGTVLVFQDGITGDFSLFNRITLKLATNGGFEQYKLSLSGNGVASEVVLPVDDSDAGWQEISIDLSEFSLNLSEVDFISVMGVGGTSSVSKIYVTDYELVKDTAITVDSNTESDFVFKASDSSVSSNLFIDDDVNFGEWSTGTLSSDTTYNNLDTWLLTPGTGWGSVIALESTNSDGAYNTDFSQYTNLKLKVASSGNFSGYDVFIGAKIGEISGGNAVEFALTEQAEWNEIDIDLDKFGADLANVSQIAVYGIYADGAAAQELYITDLIAYDTGISTVINKDSSDDKFVFISSTGEDVDIVVDGDNTVHEGNIEVGEWSTGTTITNDIEYDGLNAIRLTQGSGWGAVLAMMGDIYGGVQSYDIDIKAYSTINFKIASDASFSEYVLYFGTTVGAEVKIPLSVNSDWTNVSINIDDIPLNLDKLSQIVIYGVGASGNSIYITDFNIVK